MFLFYHLHTILHLSLVSSISLLLLFNCFIIILLSLVGLQFKAMGWYALIELWWVLPYIGVVFDFLYLGNLGLNVVGAASIAHLSVFSIYAIAYVINRIYTLSRRRILSNNILVCIVLALWHSLLFALLAAWMDQCFFPPLYWALVPIYYNANSIALLAASALSYILFSLYMVFDANPIVAKYYVYVTRILFILLVFFFSAGSFYSLLVYLFI